MKPHIQIKRAYEDKQASDGYRVFADRLWPRGVRKEDFIFDAWPKDLAPSPPLRKWFGHKVEHWDEFRESYQTELRSSEQKQRMRELIQQARKPTITLLYAAKDPDHNHALILADEMRRIAKETS